MPGLRLDVVTAERQVYSGDVDMVVAPGSNGELGILPQHAALMTTLHPGVLRLKSGREVTQVAIGGGFLEVRDNRVLVLADTAERADEIDLSRANAAESRARQSLAERGESMDVRQLDLALRRSQVRIKVAHRHRRDDLPR